MRRDNIEKDLDIVEINFVRGLCIKNLHNGVVFPPKCFLIIKYRNNTKHILNLFSNRDITSIDYYDYVKSKHYKNKVIFKENIE